MRLISAISLCVVFAAICWSTPLPEETVIAASLSGASAQNNGQRTSANSLSEAEVTNTGSPPASSVYGPSPNPSSSVTSLSGSEAKSGPGGTQATSYGASEAENTTPNGKSKVASESGSEATTGHGGTRAASYGASEAETASPYGGSMAASESGSQAKTGPGTSEASSMTGSKASSNGQSEPTPCPPGETPHPGTSHPPAQSPPASGGAAAAAAAAAAAGGGGNNNSAAAAAAAAAASSSGSSNGEHQKNPTGETGETGTPDVEQCAMHSKVLMRKPEHLQWMQQTFMLYMVTPASTEITLDSPACFPRHFSGECGCTASKWNYVCTESGGFVSKAWATDGSMLTFVQEEVAYLSETFEVLQSNVVNVMKAEASSDTAVASEQPDQLVEVLNASAYVILGITKRFIILRTCGKNSIVFVGIIEEEYNKKDKDEITHLINVILAENGIDNRDLIFLSEQFPVDTNKYTRDSEGSQGGSGGSKAAAGAGAGAGASNNGKQGGSSAAAAAAAAAASSNGGTPCPPGSAPNTPKSPPTTPPCPPTTPPSQPPTPKSATVIAGSEAGAESEGGKAKTASLSAAEATPNGVEAASLSAAEAENY